VLFITAAAATGFFVVYHLAWRLTFEIRAQSWLTLAGFVLGVGMAGCMGHMALRLLWSRRLAGRKHKPAPAPVPTDASSAVSGGESDGDVANADPFQSVPQRAGSTGELSKAREPFQFTLPVLLLSVAVVAVGVRLSTVSWTAVTGFVAIIAALLRTRQIVRSYPRIEGRPATRRELARAFASSLLVVAAILAVGLGIFCFTEISVVFLFRGWDLAQAPNLVVAWVIHLTPTLLAMVWVAKSLWPAKTRR
jgi:hypothetical protein